MTLGVRERSLELITL